MQYQHSHRLPSNQSLRSREIDPTFVYHNNSRIFMHTSPAAPPSEHSIAFSAFIGAFFIFH